MYYQYLGTGVPVVGQQARGVQPPRLPLAIARQLTSGYASGTRAPSVQLANRRELGHKLEHGHVHVVDMLRRLTGPAQAVMAAEHFQAPEHH